jgi:hypothetical protein
MITLEESKDLMMDLNKIMGYESEELRTHLFRMCDNFFNIIDSTFSSTGSLPKDYPGISFNILYNTLLKEGVIVSKRNSNIDKILS